MRRALRIALWSVGSVLALVVLLLATLLVLGNTGRGRELLARETAALSHGRVRFAGLAGSFPGAIYVAHLELADAHGVWLRADRISLRWSPLALLARRIEAQSLEAAHLDIERAPVSDPQSKSSSMPHIDIAHFAVGTLELGAQLTPLRALLSVSGSAQLRSLQHADASLRARRVDGAAGDYAFTLHMDAQSMQAQVHLSEPAGGTLESLLGIPGLGELNVSGSLAGPRSAERIELAAAAGPLRAGVHGSLDLKNLAADLTWQLDAPAMTLRPGLAWQKVSVSGNWRGPLKSAHAAARVQLDALEAGGAQIAHVSGDLRTEGVDLHTRLAATGIALPGPAPQLLSGGDLVCEASMRLDDAGHRVVLKANHPLFALSASVQPAMPQRADFVLRLPDLAPLLQAFGQELRGRSELRGRLQQNAAGLHLELTADSEVTPQTTPLAQLVSGPSRLQLTGAVSPAVLELESLRFSARHLTSSASGRAQRGDAAQPALRTLEARLEASLPDLSVLAPALGGTLQVKVELSGPPNSLAAQLQISSNLAVRSARRENLQASIKARGLPANLSAVVQARGSLLEAPLQLDASVDHDQRAGLHVRVQRATWRSAQAFADVWTAANFDPERGSAQLHIDRLADLAALLGTPLAGRVSAEASFRPAREGPSARLKVDAEDLEVGGVPLSAQLRADGPVNALELRLTGQSSNLGGEPASLDTHVHLRLDDRLLTVRHLDARYHAQTLHLLQPANVNFGDGGLTLSAVKLGVQHAVLQVEGRIAPTPDLKASLQGADAALVNAFVPDLLASGRLEAHLQMRGSFAAPTGSLELRAQDVRLAGSSTRNLQALDARASAQLDGSHAQIDARLDAGRGSHLSIGGTAPLKAAGALELHVAGALDAALANPLLEARGERATGALTVNATVTGPLKDPQVGGTLDLAQGDLRDYTQGLHLSGITAHLVGESGALRIETLVAHASPGQISMTGTIGILQPKIPVALQLTTSNAQPITSDLLTTNLDATLKLTGNLSERCDLAGSIRLHRTLIGIPNALPPDVAVLDVRRPGQAPPPSQDKPLVIGLDLQLDAPREILVQGRGLNAEMGGDLRVRGTTANPRVSGSFDMIRGVFSLASTQLNFTDGHVSFNGAGLSQRIDPSLDFNAQATAAGATVTLHIGGLATAPTFTLSSSPTLPEDEILARLLFGESASQLSGLQVAQIGVALASLSGVGGGGPNPLAKIQKALGLDRLSVGSGTTNPTTGQSTGAALEAGRYVNSRVFVGAKQSTTGYSQVEVDVDLTKRLKLQTRLGNGTAIQGTTPDNDPGSTIGFVYQLEY